MTNWLERAQTVFRKLPEVETEPSIGGGGLCTTEKCPDPELPIPPKSVPLICDGEDSGPPKPPHTERRPAMPKGVRLIRWEPKAAPVAIDVCSVVENVPKFIESELRALDSRLNNPWTIHGGFTVPQMLDRLAQAGLEVELEPKGAANQ
jgi:hypothetical protein